jgi:hypothetical protein
MPLVLIVEDGSGKSDANTYLSLAEANSYAESRLYSEQWSAATDATKNAALTMATRMIDAQHQFNGYKRTAEQALQWPRVECPDPDISQQQFATSRRFIVGPYVAEDIVPKAVKDATAELAIRMLASDRTADAQGGAGGIREVEVAGAIRVEFTDTNPTPPIPDFVTDMLWKYATSINGASSSTAKLQRV